MILGAYKAFAGSSASLPPTDHLVEFGQHEALEVIGARGFDVDKLPRQVPFSGQKRTRLVCCLEREKLVARFAHTHLFDTCRVRTDENHPFGNFKRLSCHPAIAGATRARIVRYGPDHDCLTRSPRARHER